MPDFLDLRRRFPSQLEVTRLVEEAIDPLEIELSRAELQRLRGKLKSEMLRRYLEIAEEKIMALTEVTSPSGIDEPLTMRTAG